MNRLFLKLTAASLLLTALACAGRGARSTSFVDSSRDRGLTVEVRNQNFYPATIYVYRAGGRRRLGSVEAHQTTSFTFNWPQAEVRFLVNFLAGGCLITDRLPVDNDDDLLLILEPDADRKAFQDVCSR